MKKCLKIILSLAIIIVFCPSTVWADDSDFEKNYEYNYNMCSQRGLTDEQKATCKSFRQYVASQQKAVKENVNNLNAQINTLKANITTQYKKIEEINNQISSVEKQISGIEEGIRIIEANIVQVENEIAARIAKIEELNTGIKNRMVLNQPNISSNNYIKFVMGASSFVDLLRRVSALNEITGYDVGKIKEMEAEKAQLELDKQELEQQKVELEEQKKALDEYKSSLNSLKKAAEELIAAYRASSEALGAQLANAKTDLSELESQIANIDKVLDSFFPTDGWVSPLRTTFRVTSVFPYYEPGNSHSGFHPAVDLAVNLGSKVHAVGNGYVVKTRGGCGYGYIGSSCNGGFGNYVCYIIQVGSKVYLIINAHLSQIYVRVGDRVTQDSTIIGLSGSSGSSSGPHLHVETIYMGNYSNIKDAVNSYLRVGMVYYNLGRSSYYVCGNKSAPCYDNPLAIFGLTYGRRYYY